MRLDHLSFMDICRDEDCTRRELHSPHEVRGSFTGSIVRVPARRLLVDVTFEAISTRIPKSFSQVYSEVLDNYGSIAGRNVQVALRELRDAREVAFIVPSGSQRVAHTDGVKGAYIRYDSPLLWRAGGLRDLMEVVHEMSSDWRPRRGHGGQHTRPLPTTSEIEEVACVFGN